MSDRAERELLRTRCPHEGCFGASTAEFLVKHIKGTLNLNIGTEEIQAAFDAARQHTDQHRQDAYEEFKRLYKLSPDAEALMDKITEETPEDLFGDAPIEIDFDLMAEFLATLTDEEFDELLYPFGK